MCYNEVLRGKESGCFDSSATAGKRNMKGAVYSRKLILVYTIIATVPLAALVFAGVEQLRISELRRITSAAKSDLLYNADFIADNIELFRRIENALTGNGKMYSLFLFSDKTDAAATVFQVRELSDELERLLLSMPRFYGIRIFMDDMAIPERWPVFFHRDRLEAAAAGKWQYGYRSALMGTLEMGRNTAVAYTTELSLHTRRIGTLRLLMRMTDFFPFLYRSGPRLNYIFFNGLQVIDPDAGVTPLPESLADRVIAAAEKARGGVATALPLPLAQADSGSIFFREKRRNHGFVWLRDPESGLLLVHDCTYDLNQAAFTVLRAASLSGIVISVILIFIIIRYATDRMTARLYLIVEGMEEVRKGNLNVTVSVEGNDEISGMAHTFSNMLARIKKLITEIKMEEKLLAESEIKAMQNQINAHFLYNVLETIKMRAELSNEQTIVRAITLLGKILRYGLSLKRSASSLREELEYNRSYIELLNIRNDYTITLAEDIGEDVLNIEMPRLLIQPVIENAFLYAIEPEGEDARIEVSARKIPGMDAALISIQDHGPGISPEKLRQIRDRIAGTDEAEGKSGIGLRNIQARLSIFYGPEWNIEIESVEGAGTLVRFPVPLRRGMER
jgi:two-component system sensor histidine kinase YesM